jgi:hypothetical protein
MIRVRALRNWLQAVQADERRLGHCRIYYAKASSRKSSWTLGSWCGALVIGSSELDDDKELKNWKSNVYFNYAKIFFEINS